MIVCEFPLNIIGSCPHEGLNLASLFKANLYLVGRHQGSGRKCQVGMEKSAQMIHGIWVLKVLTGSHAG